RAAEDAKQIVRDLRPTEWGTIGQKRTVVEYGLTNGEAPTWTPHPKWSLRIDLASVRAEQVRGAWVMRDDANIFLNFGTEQVEAEQASLVCRRYGFNHIGLVGFPTPLMSYFYTSKELADNK